MKIIESTEVKQGFVLLDPENGSPIELIPEEDLEKRVVDLKEEAIELEKAIETRHKYHTQGYPSWQRQQKERHKKRVDYYNKWLYSHDEDGIRYVYTYGTLKDKLEEVLKKVENGEVIEPSRAEFNRMKWMLKSEYIVRYTKKMFTDYVKTFGTAPDIK